MNDQNLIPQNKRTKSEQREIARMGGKASGAARRKKRMLREIVEAAFEREVEIDGVKLTAADAMVLKQVDAAIAGDLKAFEALRDTAGQKPSASIDVNGTLKTEQARFHELWEQLNEGRS
jgi:hypothetical protein